MVTVCSLVGESKCPLERGESRGFSGTVCSWVAAGRSAGAVESRRACLARPVGTVFEPVVAERTGVGGTGDGWPSCHFKTCAECPSWMLGDLFVAERLGVQRALAVLSSGAEHLRRWRYAKLKPFGLTSCSRAVEGHLRWARFASC